MQTIAPNSFTAPARFIAMVVALLIGAGAGGCGDGTDDSAGTASSDSGGNAEEQSNGFALESGELRIDATTSASLLPTAPTGQVNFRLMGGWVNTAAAVAAGQETDEQAQREQALRSFGTLTLSVSVSAIEPGTYELASTLEEGRQAAIVTISKSEDLGFNSAYTSASGTLTLEAIEADTGPLKGIVSAVGSFEGTFVDEEGTERPFSGTFRYVPKE